MKKFIGFLAVVAMVATSANAYGSIYNEIGDAGQLVGTAQVLPALGGGDSIVGNLIPGSDVDLFCFNWQGGVLAMDTFTATGFDSQLHLFDAAGNGIGENDDSPNGPGLRSEIALNLAAGTYYLGISAFNNDAVDAGNNDIFGFAGAFSDLNGNTIQAPQGAGPLAGWDGGTGSGGGGYTISFTGASVVPEPASLMIWTCLGAALFVRRRKS